MQTTNASGMEYVFLNLKSYKEVFKLVSHMIHIVLNNLLILKLTIWVTDS